MMDKFVRLTAVAVPLLRDNIDTDAIIPSREMRLVSKRGLADGLFAGWRYETIGGRKPTADFILNDPLYAQAQILLTGANFGCGSSREHAVWALFEYGFRAIIASSFNPIFRSNCVNNGIVPVELRAEAIATLAAQSSHTLVTVDLECCRVSSPAGSWTFMIDGEARQMLLNGMDAVELTLLRKDAIEAFRAADARARPWIYL